MTPRFDNTSTYLVNISRKVVYAVPGAVVDRSEDWHGEWLTYHGTQLNGDAWFSVFEIVDEIDVPLKERPQPTFKQFALFETKSPHMMWGASRDTVILT